MNCKNVEPLLSLYVGRDLEEEQSRLVAAHLRSCSECTLAADEYAGASQLLQGYEPPFFSDEIYAGIRGQVLNEIKREFRAPVRPGIFSQVFLALVQPRMRWITAVVLLAISVTALYLSRNPSHQLPNQEQVTVRTGEPTRGGGGADVRSRNSNESASSSLLSHKAQDHVSSRRLPTTARRKANAGLAANNRSQHLHNTKVDAATSESVVQRHVDVSQPSTAPVPLRVEMQTSNQNIRIIWLSTQRPRAGARDGSKGI